MQLLMGHDGHKRQPIMRMKRRKWLATSYETISYGLEHYGHGEWKNFFFDYFQSSTYALLELTIPNAQL